ncbi:CBS domain-containing protein [Flavobacterium sp.]|uniref:CBS domain-containing protein n=1 Tax=Flavobacterium sp. TaxID=239 RepID=UPI002607F5C2|nr:CBS domain-containing protein [Flavobacterium sp.]
MTVNQIISKKGGQVHTVLPNLTVFEALKLMCDKNIGAILVVEEDVLKGILSERDYARKVVLKDKNSKNTLVHEIMDLDFTAVKPSDSIDYCMELMSSKRVRHLPVVDQNKLINVISIGDVVQAIIEVQKDTIEHLNSYITQ